MWEKMIMKEVSYKELFDNIQCDLSIFFEDDFTYSTDFSMKSVLYRIVRIDKELSFNPLIKKLNEADHNFAESIRDFVNEFRKYEHYIDNWNDVIIDDIDSAVLIIQKCDSNAFNNVSMKMSISEPSNLDEVRSILCQFGVDCLIPNAYTPLFNEYIWREKVWKPFYIFTSYSADVKSELENMLSGSDKSEAIVCCYIDNNLRGENKAQQIIDDLEKLTEKQVHFIGAVVTSQDPFDRITDKIFIDTVLKKNIPIQLKSALLRSVYHYLLHSIKRHYINAITEAFKKAGAHRNIALYLSDMAKMEGISNYSLFVEWLKGLTDYYSSQYSYIEKMIPIANLIERQSENDESEVSDDLSDLSDYNTFEAFDYKINEYCLPVEPGDIFITDDNQIYILVGQACDMAMGEARSRRNGLCEMVKATFVTTADSIKVADDQKNIWINYYKKEGTYGKLKIDYQKRFFIENEILSLAIYNKNGFCTFTRDICLNNSLLQDYQIGYYDSLRKFFESIITLNDSCADASKAVLANRAVNWVCSLLDYTIQSNEIRYSIRRVCRLKDKYLIFLYKLFLEYRGRIPFNTISMNRTIPLEVDFIYSGSKLQYTVDVLLNKSNDTVKLDWPWIISSATIDDLLIKIGSKNKTKDDKSSYIIEGKQIDIELDGGKVLKLTKKTKKSINVSIE